jgi:hypothetical protein
MISKYFSRSNSANSGKIAELHGKLLTGTALVACTRQMLVLSAIVASGPALANSATVGGVIQPDTSPAFIWLTLPVSPAVVNVSTVDIAAGGLNAVWVTALGAQTDVTVAAGRSVTTTAWGIAVSSTTGDINVVNNGTVSGGVAGIYANPRFAPDGGNVSISGTGVVNSAAGPAILAEMDTGNVNINGFSAIKGGTYGVQVFTGGTWTGNPGGAFNLGTVTPLGAITATGVGIGTAQANLFGEAATTIRATSITAGVTGISSSSTTGKIDIATTGAVTATSGFGIFASTTSGAVIADGKGTSTLTGGIDGINIVTASGNATVQNFASVNGLRNGIYVVGSAGTTSVQGNGPITGSTLNGIVVGPSSGDVNIGTTATNGVIAGGVNGIWVNNTLAGKNTIVQNNNITGGTAGSGIVTGAQTGATSITATAATTGGVGIWAVSTTGNILADGKGTGKATGTVTDGILYGTASGNATVQNFAAVNGARNGMYVVGSAGTTSIQGNGLTGGVTGTALNGIVVGPSSGNVNIGTSATNGVITGGVNGIWVNNSGGAGNTAITVDKNVTGTAGDGILSTTLSGNQTNTITGPAVVQGALYGLATATTTGTATTNNTGTIQNIGDAVGAASNPGLQAVWLGSGTNVVNNNAGGQIIGGFTTGGIASTLNNNAAAVWTPSLANSFGAVNDTVNNAGLINVRAGTTTFAGLENLNNVAGGKINMAYNAAATDNLVTQNFSPKAGSAINVNFDAAGTNNAALGFDSANGKGTADTIVVTGVATPQAKSTVNLVATGGAPTSLTGSVALVYTGVNLVAPTPGATITQSANYAFGTGDPSNGKTVYYLVDDGKGGVYMQWAPNLSAASLGGFGGAIGGGAQSAPGSAIGSVAGGSAGLGGVGLGGGPAGGGVAGRIGDMAASNATPSNSSVKVGSTKDGYEGGDVVSQCHQGRYAQAWGQVEGERTRYTGGFSGRSESLSGGAEVDIGRLAGLGCSKLAVGVFGFTASGSSNWASGSSNSDNSGFGGYLRASTSLGLYATAMGASNWSDAKLANLIYGSTATKDARGITASGAVGYLLSFGQGTALDFRGFASNAHNKSGPFTDSVGITVSETKDGILTYGVSLGVHQAITSNLQAFVRAGLKKSELDSSVTAFDNTRKGSVSARATGLEAGLVGNIGKDVEIGVTGFGSFSDGANGVGGRAHLGIKF